MTGAAVIVADFTLADLRGAGGFSPGKMTVTRNTVWPDGRVEGLDLVANDTLVVHDVDQPIVVEDRFTIAENAVLDLLLNGESWGSTMTVRRGLASPQLGGTLRVGFDASLSLPQVAQMKGSTYDLFDWGGPVDVTNRFDQIELPARTEWDLSRLYTTGEIVLIFSIALPGDANVDFRFDQLDIIQLLNSTKYLTGNPATWEQGDWNGDGVFDQLDLVAALQTGTYLQGPYALRVASP